MDADDAPDGLAPIVYETLRRLAGRMVRQGATLTPTSLVHDAWLKVGDKDWNDEQHFMAVAARAMRQILADRARYHAAEKRGGREAVRTTLSGLASPSLDVSVIDLHEALTELEAQDPIAARIVELRYLAGRTVTETAAILGMSRSSVQDSWRLSRAWLVVRLTR